MDKIINIMNVEREGNVNCNHKWCCNPMSEMMIKEGRMVFIYDRICENCLRKETVKSNRKGENFRKYKGLL